MAALAKPPIISVKETRKLLGNSAKGLTDDEVNEMVRDYEIMARQAIREFLVHKSEVVKYGDGADS